MADLSNHYVYALLAWAPHISTHSSYKEPFERAKQHYENCHTQQMHKLLHKRTVTHLQRSRTAMAQAKSNSYMPTSCLQLLSALLAANCLPQDAC
jgi:hypothetical protein